MHESNRHKQSPAGGAGLYDCMLQLFVNRQKIEKWKKNFNSSVLESSVQETTNFTNYTNNL